MCLSPGGVKLLVHSESMYCGSARSCFCPPRVPSVGTVTDIGVTESSHRLRATERNSAIYRLGPWYGEGAGVKRARSDDTMMPGRRERRG